jgi:hypothetical protein
MLCTNKYTLTFFGVLLACCTHALSETVTVDAAIEAAKLKKSSAGVVKPEVKNEPLPSAVAIAKPLPAPVEVEPKLWSIKGINNNYTAEIIIANKIFQVPLKVGSSFEEWEVLSYDSESITIHKKSALTQGLNKTADKSKFPTHKTVQLFANQQGKSILQFQIQQDGEINTLQRRTAANLPVNMHSATGKN